jgi:hypothetical protein
MLLFFWLRVLLLFNYKEKEMIVELLVNNLSVSVALDEADDIESAMYIVGRIKELAEELSEFDCVDVSISSVEEEVEEEDDYEVMYHRV